MKTSKNEKIDHINRNKLDDRRKNLRICTVSQNGINRPKCNSNCTSRYKGVYLIPKTKSWKSGLKINNKSISFGNYPTELEAAYIYNQNVSKYFGEFSVYNDLSQKDIDILKETKIKTMQEKRKIYTQYPNVSYNICKKCWVWKKTINKKVYTKQYFKTEEEAHNGFLKFEEELKYASD